MDKSNLKIAATLTALFLAIALPVSIAYLALTAHIQLPTSGVTTTAGLELYQLDGTTPQTTLDWGTIGNGTYPQQSILKNVGNTDLTLSMTTDESYTWLDFSWNQEGTVLADGSQITITWTLTITDAPEGANFNFNITITGTET